MTNDYNRLLKTGALQGANQAYLEAMYLAYLDDPKSVSSQWSQFFTDNGDIKEILSQQHPVLKEKLKYIDYAATSPSESDNTLDIYRRYGHLGAASDAYAKQILPTWEDCKALIDSGASQLSVGSKEYSYQDALKRLDSLYCGATGYEFMHIEDESARNWWIKEVEDQPMHLESSHQLQILRDVTQAHELERYLGIQFVGQKRFSLEGLEAMIPTINRVVDCLSASGIRDQVIGMAHRGRLNVLVNVMGMSVKELVDEFTGARQMDQTSGDVKYHLGYSIDREVQGDLTHLTLNYNPSHLEAVNSVVCGNVRARNDRYHREPEIQQTPAAGILIHGDASLAGQGSVMEILNMAYVDAYSTEGTIHIVANNQIGFTTDPDQDRSGRYCTDIAKMIQAPVIHVDGDDIEACVFAATIAVKWRQAFKKDIFIDVQGYRKFGHNEADEPRATQPKLYASLKSHQGAAKIYQDQLIRAGVISEEDVKKMTSDIRSKIEQGDSLVKFDTGRHSPRHTDWQRMQLTADDAKTAITNKQIAAIGEKVFHVPQFPVQKQVMQTLSARLEMLAGKTPFNWGFGELLAYGALLEDGYNVRLVGQDSQRGTFSHRHSVLHDQDTGATFCALSEMLPGDFFVYNSTLSEYAAMGFEYGYAETDPNTLVIWEAQFGDFANGAQVIFDQFISSAWQKWKRYCGLVLLLPHGYEGQGPEHSSARLERLLQLCAQNNMEVAAPTTPAQIFHLLRNQMLRDMRTPLAIISPKSLLRNPMASSSLTDITTGCYQRVIADDKVKGKVDKVVLCQGKIYYELLKMRDDNKKNIAIVRLETLYPFPHDALKEALAKYKTNKITWCQEEPFNQGAWLCIRHEIEKHVGNSQLSFCSREAQASPAVGYASWHNLKQQGVLKQALDLHDKE